MKKALLIFVKNLVFGHVKTRLAETLGHAEALTAYRRLVVHTQQVTTPVQADKFVFYSNFIEDQGWPSSYDHSVQAGNDLGGRMSRAFEQVFERGSQTAVIIGSDCLELSTAIIEEAFAQLEMFDAVIGPAKDGGYYLLGLKHPAPALFQGIAWSTNSVFSHTIDICRQLGFRVALLPELSDIDEAEGWMLAKKTLYE